MRFWWLLCFCLNMGLTGCGQPSDRLAFSGSVTVDDDPVTGSIRFAPIDKGPMAMTSISNGRYNFTPATGPVPGNYNVRIELMPAAGKKGAGAELVVPQSWTVPFRIEPDVKFNPDFPLNSAAADARPE